jgi:hypothetical protein
VTGEDAAHEGVRPAGPSRRSPASGGTKTVMPSLTICSIWR